MKINSLVDSLILCLPHGGSNKYVFFLLHHNVWVNSTVIPLFLNQFILLLFAFLCSQVNLDELYLSKINKLNMPFHVSFQNCSTLLLYSFHSTEQFTAINNVTFIYIFFSPAMSLSFPLSSQGYKCEIISSFLSLMYFFSNFPNESLFLVKAQHSVMSSLVCWCAFSDSH